MAVYLVDKDALVPLSYTAQGLATIAAVAAVDHAAEIKTVTAGVYGPQTINNSAIANTRYTNTVGNDYTIALDPAVIAAWDNGEATVFEGGTITSGTRDAIRPAALKSIELRDFRWNLTDVGGYGYGARLNGAGASMVLKRGVIGGACSISAVVRIRPGTVATYLECEDVGVKAEVVCSTAPIYAWEGTPSVVIRNSGYALNTPGIPLLSVTAGLTLPVLTLEGNHARAIVASPGAVTVTALTAAHNVCFVNHVSATGATDVLGVADRRLGGPDGLTPLHDSKLRTVIPRAMTIGTSKYDALGNPRNRGRRCVGPVQPQDFVRYSTRRGLAALAVA